MKKALLMVAVIAGICAKAQAVTARVTAYEVQAAKQAEMYTAIRKNGQLVYPQFEYLCLS